MNKAQFLIQQIFSIWIIGCIMFVFGALCGYAMILVILFKSKLEDKDKWSRMADSFFIVAFPVLFFFFNFAYWFKHSLCIMHTKLLLHMILMLLYSWYFMSWCHKRNEWIRVLFTRSCLYVPTCVHIWWEISQFIIVNATKQFCVM